MRLVQIGVTDQRNVNASRLFCRLGELAVAAGVRTPVDNHAAGLHDFQAMFPCGN